MTSSDNQVIYTPITHHLFPPFFNVVNKFRLFFSSQSAQWCLSTDQPLPFI